MRVLPLLCLALACSSLGGERAATVAVAPRPVNSFSVREALGAGVDGQEQGDAALVYTPANLRAMLSAGFQPLTCRLRTELAIEAWHWNPAGSWSCGKRREGYWTSDAPGLGYPVVGKPSPSVTPAHPSLRVSYGYRLPRRGTTTDEANNDGYSRLDDGETATFWKSNPYLDSHFTGEDNALHPQWIVMDFGRRVRVNAARLVWAQPYAKRYRLEYWRGPDRASYQTTGNWVTFARGRVTAGRGGDVTLRLAAKPVSARFVRIVMTEGSGTAPAGSADIRDRLGFALRELYVGELRGDTFHDAIRHGRAKGTQTRVWASSTDPWHRASDRDPHVEQPGIDLVCRSGLTNGLPMLVPVGVLFDTPENAAALVHYILSRGYPIRGVELGEEPDGQMASPEDYGALYVQFAAAIHVVDPTLMLGGPSYEEIQQDVWEWPERKIHGSWNQRFLAYLKRRGRLADLGFLSFEWYPFEHIGLPTAPQLASSQARLRNAVHRIRADGLPASVPLVISEYGYSAYAAQPEVDIEGALLNADIAGEFLTLGGQTAYLYGYEPNTLINEKGTTWGNIMLFLADDQRRIRCPLPTYYAAQLVTKHWAGPANAVWDVYPASCDNRDVSVYALKRTDVVPGTRSLPPPFPEGEGKGGGSPEEKAPRPTTIREDRLEIAVLPPPFPKGEGVGHGQDARATWSFLLINKDPRKAHRVRLPIAGPADLWQYSREQYLWHAGGPRGHPTRNLPPVHTKLAEGGAALRLPPYSLTVVRGRT